MLPRARLGNNARLAQPLGQHGLPQRIVNLVGAHVGQVLALEPNLRALRILREPTGVVQRRRTANIVPTQVLELLPKARVLRCLHVRVNEVMMRLNERLDKTATKLPKTSIRCYLGSTKMLRDFNLVRVLKRTDTELALLGKFKSDRHKKAAVLIIKTATMDMKILNQLIVKMTLHNILMNDIYNTFLGDVSRDVKPYKVNLIYPATDRHVRKHTYQKFYMVVETKEAYRKITKPYIDSIPPDSIDWVYNILEQ
ncbi:hypothetical protein PsorP6_014722 [Peronosclerospora sorghi]|uniref:Uncharacterized protein n=1 Tax=Peronosclerospora sorghi TaxID=230839 RepID=A0ACC0VR69_9STRA|nr:hypothetical protein PsorP6_014722 [Peronosclerospora sorghi]